MKKLRTIITSLILIFAVVVIGGISMLNVSKAVAITSAKELFVNASGVTVKQNAEAPDTFLDYKGNTIARDFDLGMHGVLLNSDKVGSTIELAPTFSGDFSMTFRAYSDVSFGSDEVAEFNTDKYVMTSYADLREISFIFEDETGKSFTIAIAAGEKYNV
ncbi:MAG: hypothetical protein J6U92_00450, partial [Clostridia bacterium]|nr:hypothetical protein [Clostridia bacterium]